MAESSATLAALRTRNASLEAQIDALHATREKQAAEILRLMRALSDAVDRNRLAAKANGSGDASSASAP